MHASTAKAFFTPKLYTFCMVFKSYLQQRAVNQLHKTVSVSMQIVRLVELAVLSTSSCYWFIYLFIHCLLFDLLPLLLVAAIYWYRCCFVGWKSINVGGFEIAKLRRTCKDGKRMQLLQIGLFMIINVFSIY